MLFELGLALEHLGAIAFESQKKEGVAGASTRREDHRRHDESGPAR
jgi:hypothetical protein